MLDPTEFVAVMLKEVEVKVDVGVPEITQEELLMVAHAGKEGEVIQEEMGAPLVFKIDGATDIVLPTLPFVPVLET